MLPLSMIWSFWGQFVEPAPLIPTVDIG